MTKDERAMLAWCAAAVVLIASGVALYAWLMSF